MNTAESNTVKTSLPSWNRGIWCSCEESIKLSAYRPKKKPGVKEVRLPPKINVVQRLCQTSSKMQTAESRPAGVRKFDPTYRQNLKKRTPAHRCTNLPPENRNQPTPSKVVAVRVLCLKFFSRSHLCAPSRNVSFSKKDSVATCTHRFRFRPRRTSWSDISQKQI